MQTMTMEQFLLWFLERQSKKWLVDTLKDDIIGCAGPTEWDHWIRTAKECGVMVK